MLNQIVIVGRLVKEVEYEEEKNAARITLAVPRSYKNEKGEYETDFIPCVLYNGIAQNTVEYCKKGDLIGVKGKIQRYGNDYTANGFPILKIIVEKVTFLSNKKLEE
jgi:single-strand DNA-binding protein